MRARIIVALPAIQFISLYQSSAQVIDTLVDVNGYNYILTL